MIPFWLILIRAHKEGGGYALSLPFLIGAMRDPVGRIHDGKEENLNDISRLLLSIRDDTPDELNIIITICDRLQRPVFSESSSFINPPKRHTCIQKQNNDECHLYVTPSILSNDKNTISEFSEALWSLNTGLLCNGHFSYRRDAFVNFNSKDLELISRAKRKLEDEEASHGRNARYQAPPAQTRTCGFSASGSSVVLAFATGILSF